MAQAGVGVQNRGSTADYVLGTAEGWDAFQVVRWHGIEAISQPFQIDITLMRTAAQGPIDLDALLDADATFRISTQSRWRPIHGIVAEAEEIDRTAQVFLYRALVVPHFYRARYRRRCRNFHKQSLHDIVTAVLENRSPAHPKGNAGLVPFSADPTSPAPQPSFTSFAAPAGFYRWEVTEPERIHDAEASPYIVQYNESDFDFVSRLLEQEGLSYYFEHTDAGSILAITDAPNREALAPTDTSFSQRRVGVGGQTNNQEIVRVLRNARRLSSRAVTMREYDYQRSLTKLEATSQEAHDNVDRSEHFEFPAGEDSVQDNTALHAADVRLQRQVVERNLREGAGTLRTLEPGHRFTLHDADGLHDDIELFAVRVETFATELAPQQTILDEEPFGFAQATGPLAPGFDSRFLALTNDLKFRPAMRTPKPRIHGVQSAVITAEEYDSDRPTINADKQARVRVRFPWDQRADTGDKTPTSRWIRVSQYWAGAGYGALYTPRVGHEVLVAYMQGDPDHPVIVGRVYNGQNTPPYNPEEQPTRSTVKSNSATETKEVDGFNEIRFEDRAKKEEIYLHAQRNFNETVLASHSTSVGGDQSNSVGGNQASSVSGHRTHSVDGFETITVGADRKIQIGGTQTSTAVADFIFNSTNALFNTDTDFQVASTAAVFRQSTSFYVHAGGCTLSMSAGKVILTNGAGSQLSMIGGHIEISGADAVVRAKSFLAIDSGGPICATGTVIKLNG
ncbi:MAG: type VI secretion system tip protein TssI/VgrG [Byssovorax sp.]